MLSLSYEFPGFRRYARTILACLNFVFLMYYILKPRIFIYEINGHGGSLFGGDVISDVLVYTIAALVSSGLIARTLFFATERRWAAGRQLILFVAFLSSYLFVTAAIIFVGGVIIWN